MKTIEAVKLISDDNMVLTDGKILAKAVILPKEEADLWMEVAIEEEMKKRILPTFIK